MAAKKAKKVKAPLTKEEKAAKRAAREREYIRRVVEACKSVNLSTPSAEVMFYPERKWRFDFAWQAERVALEIDGGVWSGGRHGRGSGIVKEHEKFNSAASLRWRVFRTTPQALSEPKLWAQIKEAVSPHIFTVESMC